MIRWNYLTLITLAVCPPSATAQVIFPGSTVQGDYLRGVGVAAAGLGSYNRNTAIANSINTDTTIRWNEYIAAVVKNENREKAEHKARLIAQNRANYSAILQRIRENPEERDVLNGDSLNERKKDLLDPKHYAESAFRFAEVPLPVETVRRIPFKIGAEGVTFSLRRLTARGKEKWPPGLQDPAFAGERRTYENAIDAILEQQIEGKMTLAAIANYESAVNGLFQKLDQVIDPSKDKLYREAKNVLVDMKKALELIKSHKVELVLGEIDRYSGTTVRDLLLLMQKYNLDFGVAQSADEKGLYPELYASLLQQQEMLNGSSIRSTK